MALRPQSPAGARRGLCSPRPALGPRARLTIVPAAVAAAAAGDPALRRWAEKAGRRAAATEEHAGSCGPAGGGRGGHVGTPRLGPRPRPDPRAPRGLGRPAPRGPEPGPDGTAPCPLSPHTAVGGREGARLPEGRFRTPAPRRSWAWRL